jgi:hypothetical protein
MVFEFISIEQFPQLSIFEDCDWLLMVGFGGQDEHAASPVCFFDPNRDGLWNQAGGSAILLVENGSATRMASRVVSTIRDLID